MSSDVNSTNETPPLTERPAWRALQAHHAQIAPRHLRDLFADDPGRGERLTAEAPGCTSTTPSTAITDETLRLLIALAEESGAARADRRDVRAASRSTSPSTARSCMSRCGCPATASLVVDGVDVVAEVHGVLDRMAALRRRACARARGGATPASASATVVNIGIGGSDLGPVMAYEALRHFSHARPRRSGSSPTSTRTDFVEATRDLDPAETLFIVSSKTFTTLETMTNAHSARDWLLAGARRRGRGRHATSWRCRPTPRPVARVRHRHREHVRLLGLGRRALLDGLRDRPVDDARDRAGAVPRAARRLPRDGRALPHRPVRPRTCRC